MVKRSVLGLAVLAAVAFGGCFLSAGCGGGGGDSPAPVVESKPSAPVDALTIESPGRWITGADPYLNATGRLKTGCGATGRTAVIVVAGQSLSVNNVPTLYTPTEGGNRQMNIYDGECYETREPMLGINMSGGPIMGTWMSRFADKLIAGGHFDRVILVPMAVGNTNTYHWADKNAPPYLYRAIDVVGKRLALAGLTCTAVMWGQGESDTRDHTAQATYESDMLKIVSYYNAAMPGCPVLVARESYYYGVTSPAVLAAQTAVVNGTTIFAGEDVDSIGSAGRYDDTHLNAVGAEQRANLAMAALLAVPGLRNN